MRWAALKVASAQVTYKVKNGIYIPASPVMSFSNQVDHSLEELVPILLHEMIHVYFMVTNQHKVQHGPLFVAKLNQLSSAVGFKIPLTDEVSANKLINIPIKPVGVLVREMTNGRFAAAMVSPNALKAAPSLEGFDAYIVTSTVWSNIAATRPVQRSFNPYKTKWFWIDEEALGDLSENGQRL